MTAPGFSKEAVVVYPQANITIRHVIRDSRCVPWVALACEECEIVLFSNWVLFSVLPSSRVDLLKRRVEMLPNGFAQVHSDF